MIKCVIYDLDDTLYDFNEVNPPAYRMPEDILALEPDKVDVAAVHSRTLRLSYTLNTLGLPLFPHVLELYDLYWNYILEHMRREPHIEEVMQELKKRGIKIGIGTNMTARMQYRKLYELGLGPYLDFVTTSDESIFDKPDERFFQLVVRKAGCLPEECLFVGDNYRFDYGGAVKAGLNGLWYNRLEKPWNRVTEEEKAEAIRNDVMITDHREVLNRLG